MQDNIAPGRVDRLQPDMDARGIVYSIQRYTVHDGPGTRTSVFLKGCTMSCLWCCNPESWDKNPEVAVYEQRCIGVEKCGYCLDACPFTSQGIFRISEEGLVAGIDRSLCTRCMACVDECPANALARWGEDMTVAQVMREVLKDREFFDETGGGITVSGGELFVQTPFVVELLKACRAADVHTCIETALGVPWNLVAQALPYTEYVLTDIKHMDADKHRAYTGCDLALVLDNLKRLGRSGIPSVIRVPLIPGYNDSDENIEATARFIASEFGSIPRQVQVLQFHELGKTKYETLGKAYPLADMKKPPREDYVARLKSAIGILRNWGLPAYVGSNVKMTR